jgi:hypothetical protein
MSAPAQPHTPLPRVPEPDAAADYAEWLTGASGDPAGEETESW